MTSKTKVEWNADEFRAWLESKAPESTVGFSDSLGACPLANWRFHQKGETLSISADTVVDMETGKEFWTNDWVETFVQEIDGKHVEELSDDPDDGDFDYLSEPVTAYECIEVLGYTA